MDRTEVIGWTTYLCDSLRRSQAKTLGFLVGAACEMVRASLAELGRCLSLWTHVAVKHCIKRVDRFVGNPRVEPIEAMRPVIAFLARPRKQLLLSLDWVEVRALHCLVLAARLHGRAVPLLWAVYREQELFRSQNSLEYGLLRALRTMVPAGTEVLLLADRGFGRTQMAKVCQDLGFHYVIRITPDVYICSAPFTGKLLDLPVRPGCRQVLRRVAYRKRSPVIQNVAVLWPRGQAEPWFLMTDLPRLQARRLAKIFGHRMTIEEYFRDMKSKRNGFGLRLTLIGDPQRLARFLLVLAMAYLLLVAIGLHAATRYRSGVWCSTNRAGECSLFQIGRFMCHQPVPRLLRLLKDLRKQLLEPNWG
jgi:hypothetical protein